MAHLTPVMLHDDGSECGHEGPAKRTVDDESGPACSAGVAITHVRFNGKDILIADAVIALSQVGRTLAGMLTPMISRLALLFRDLADDPAVRVAVQAAAAVEAERAREEA